MLSCAVDVNKSHVILFRILPVRISCLSLGIMLKEGKPSVLSLSLSAHESAYVTRARNMMFLLRYTLRYKLA